LPAVPDLVSVPDIFIPLFSVDAWQLGRVKTLYREHLLVDWIEDEGEPYGGICLAAVFVGSLVVAPTEPKETPRRFLIPAVRRYMRQPARRRPPATAATP
jgi:hypothetical protein